MCSGSVAGTPMLGGLGGVLLAWAAAACAAAEAPADTLAAAATAEAWAAQEGSLGAVGIFFVRLHWLQRSNRY